MSGAKAAGQLRASGWARAVNLRGFIRSSLVATLACLLSACWLSDRPLLTDDNSSAVDFTGTYRGLDEEARSDLVIAATGSRAYEVRQGGEHIAVRYLKLKGDWYLAQYEGKDEDAGDGEDAEVVYLYQPLRAAGGRLYMYSADCDDTPGDFAGMKRESGACSFSSPEGLADAALAFIGRVERGEISGDPAIWVKVSVTRP
ncbi:hypothetical protein [Altererythrobacter fulvus]|uniref:hypothetical protein n=1 Tax=Caenibius fulvus TaxID=2126012 RepID=UPI0030172F08